FGEETQCDPSVTAVRTLPAHRRDPPGVGITPQDRVGHGPSRLFHHRVDVMALLGGAHLGRRVERRQHHPSSTTATALASWRECVIERSIACAPICSAQRATRPVSATDGFGLPAISTSSQANARATPNPRALPTAS